MTNWTHATNKMENKVKWQWKSVIRIQMSNEPNRQHLRLSATLSSHYPLSPLISVSLALSLLLSHPLCLGLCPCLLPLSLPVVWACESCCEIPVGKWIDWKWPAMKILCAETSRIEREKQIFDHSIRLPWLATGSSCRHVICPTVSFVTSALSPLWQSKTCDFLPSALTFVCCLFFGARYAREHFEENKI